MEIKTIVAEKHLLKHPFYQLWLDGKLPQQALAEYSKQYFQLVNNLPRFISKIHANCSDVKTRQHLITHLMEEEFGTGNGNIAHTQLWLDFAEELGVSETQVMQAEILPETKEVINVINQECDNSLKNGAAALYAYESQVPEISVEKIKGLKECYNITTDKALRFFEVHKTADVKHGNSWQVLAKDETLSAKKTVDALWKMFDAMHKEFVPSELKSC